MSAQLAAVGDITDQSQPPSPGTPMKAHGLPGAGAQMPVLIGGMHAFIHPLVRASSKTVTELLSWARHRSVSGQGDVVLAALTGALVRERPVSSLLCGAVRGEQSQSSSPGAPGDRTASGETRTGRVLCCRARSQHPPRVPCASWHHSRGQGRGPHPSNQRPSAVARPHWCLLSHRSRG